MHADLVLALALADEADALSLPRFRDETLAVETKPDLTPVTEADRAVEARLRELIARERPADGVLGEEGGETGSARRRWIVDPIDGTRNFSRGLPVWATLIALEADGVVEAGVVSAPALGRRWWAARGEGAFADGEPLSVSRIARVEDAVVSFSPTALRPGREPVLELARRAWHPQPFSDFWMHVLVAEGAADVAIDPVVEAWDVAAVKVVVEEAGGRVTDLAGRDGVAGGSAVSTNGLLHDEVLRALGGS
jgi:histidinol-phosphatase